MSRFDGKAFLVGIQHLDADSRELFARHGKRPDGRLGFIEQIVDEAMLRLVGTDLQSDPYDIEKVA